MLRKENYAGAICIAYRLYCKYIKDIDFNAFEKLISENYNDVVNEINNEVYI